MSSAAPPPATNGTPTNAAANVAVPQAGSAPASTAPAQSSASASGIQTSSSTSHNFAGDPLNTVQYINDPAWPSDLRLDRDKSNWKKWSHRIKIICDRQGFTDWLDNTFPIPDPITENRAHRIWTINDRSLRAFLVENISDLDYKAVCDIPTSRGVYAELRNRHEKLGGHTQILLIERAMKLRFRQGVSLSQTLNEIDNIADTIEAIGPVEHAKLRTAFVTHALGGEFENLQSSVQSITKQPNFTYNDIVKRILEEEDLIRNRGGQSITSSSTALITQAGTRTRPYCHNCKRLGHLTDFCIRPGGKMEGRSLDDAKAAQRAASQRSSRSNNPSNSQSASANVAIAETVPAENTQTIGPSIMVNGIAYVPTPTPTISKPPTPSTDSALCALTSTAEYYRNYDFEAFLAVCGKPHASVDWNNHNNAIDLNQIPVEPVAFSASRVPITTECPFFLDTGATAHITPERSDFKSLQPIAPYPISGIGGSCIYAVGTGTVELCIANGHKLSLDNVLFVPASKVRLISVLTLNRSGHYTSHFNADCFWLTNQSGTTILRGTVHEQRRLYTLNLQNARITHKKAANTNGSDADDTSVLIATRVPNVESWHRRLGHCSFNTIVDAARDKTVQGMAINLSSSPPKCNTCILGKQTRSPVPKMREGERANSPFERVFVDLCGPIHPVSTYGHCYTMNIVDDFSNYVWCLPLRSKADAAPVLQQWHHAVENQTGHHLQCLITDNGELVSKSMEHWCSQFGIDHRTTAPYTSAQNGRVEQMHRTLFDKARSMRLSCNAQ